METENAFELLRNDDTIKAITNYSVAGIWEKRPFLSGSADYQTAPDSFVDIKREDKN